MGKKKTKKKLKKRIGARLVEGERALVVCVGKKCAPREESRAVVDAARSYVAETMGARGPGSPKVSVAVFGCLGICKKGPIVATLPKVHFSKRVDADKVRRILGELFEEADEAIREEVRDEPHVAEGEPALMH